jgi:positive phototaxis protein PixI
MTQLAPHDRMTASIEPAEPAPAASAQSYLHFSLAPEVLLSTQYLTEIWPLPLAQIVPMPATPAAVMGIGNWRGEVLWLLDLGYLLGQPPLGQKLSASAHFSAVVVHDHDRTLGLVVDKLGGMQRVMDTEIGPSGSPPVPAAVAPLLTGCWLSKAGLPHWVLDCQALLQFFQLPAAPEEA